MTPATAAFPPFRAIGIVGVGLIGGSIAAALKVRGYRGEILGCGRNQSRLDAAVSRGLLDSAMTDVRGLGASCELVVVCTPVDRIAGDVLAAATNARPGTLVTDAGSVKQSICDDLDGRLPNGITFVGSHPLAGSEKQGFEHADAKLFEGRMCVLTPVAATPEREARQIAGFWQSLGMHVAAMSPAEHDRALAQTSHVPHAVAAALASTIEVKNSPFAATGFRDATRIAAGDPELWTAILMANAGEITHGLDRMNDALTRLRTAVSAQDAAAIKKLLAEAQAIRQSLGSNTTTNE